MTTFISSHVKDKNRSLSLSTSMHRMEENKTLIMAFNLEMIVSVRARVKLSNYTVPRHTLLYRGNKEKPVLFKYKLLLAMNRAEWRKGICHILFKGRRFSPSLSGGRYLKLSSKGD